MSEKRPTIGFLTNLFTINYTMSMCRGAALAAEEKDVNIIFLPGWGLSIKPHDAKHAQNVHLSNTIYSFVRPGLVDALVIPIGTIAGQVSASEKREFLSRFDGIPLLICEHEFDGYPSVTFSPNGIRIVMEHIISAHNCRRIAFVSGPKGNPDADSRLEVYKETLLKNGISYDPSLVTYGDFTEYSVDIIGELLDRHKDSLPDAICFANDSMVLGGYTAMRERGIVPGKDIIVTGYDNTSFTSVIDPPLTTIDTGVARLGYISVQAAVELAKTGSTQSISLDPSLVIRKSCRCTEELFSSMTLKKKLSAEKYAELVIERLPEINPSDECTLPVRMLKDFLIEFFSEALDRKQSCFSHDKLRVAFSNIISTKLMCVIERESMYKLFDHMRFCAEPQILKSEKLLDLYNLLYELQSILNDYYSELSYNDARTYQHNSFLISNITKDMTANSKDTEKCYMSLIDIVSRIGHDSTYIYEFEQPIKRLLEANISSWRAPEFLLLKAYHNRNELNVLYKEDQLIPVSSIFSNSYTPNDRRRTTVLSPLLFNDESYGVMLAELDTGNFQQLDSVSQQICTAIKMISVMSMLEGIIDRVTQRNAILSHESVSDELTGILNRRGFFSEAEKTLLNRSRSNTSQKCAVLFADVNNLKVINDTFGHEEGDYTIRTAAQILKTCLRSTDIVGRVGGDEFAALMIYSEPGFVKQITRRIKQFQDELNFESDKPYYVEICFGIHEFDPSEGGTLQRLLDSADNKLYIDKKSKRPSVFKPGYTPSTD